MPEFFDKMFQGIDKGVTTVSVKSRELIEVTRITAQIAALNEERKNALAELGAVVLDLAHRNEIGPTPAVLERCETIREIDRSIQEKEAEQRRIRQEANQALGIEVCPGCGSKVGEPDRFCRTCGYQLRD
jgi:ribosomal protein L32